MKSLKPAVLSADLRAAVAHCRTLALASLASERRASEDRDVPRARVPRMAQRSNSSRNYTSRLAGSLPVCAGRLACGARKNRDVPRPKNVAICSDIHFRRCIYSEGDSHSSQNLPMFHAGRRHPCSSVPEGMAEECGAKEWQSFAPHSFAKSISSPPFELVSQSVLERVRCANFASAPAKTLQKRPKSPESRRDALLIPHS